MKTLSASIVLLAATQELLGIELHAGAELQRDHHEFVRHGTRNAVGGRELHVGVLLTSESPAVGLLVSLPVLEARRREAAVFRDYVPQPFDRSCPHDGVAVQE